MVCSPPESSEMLCSFLPGGRATISMPLLSTSSSSTSTRSALPPSNTSVNSVRKLSRICSKVALNISVVSVLICSITSSNCSLALTRSSCCVVRNSYRSSVSSYSSMATRFTGPMRSTRSCNSATLSSTLSQSVSNPSASISSRVAKVISTSPESVSVVLRCCTSTSRRSIWYLASMRSQRFSTIMLFCASSTSSCERRSCDSLSSARTERNDSSRSSTFWSAAVFCSSNPVIAWLDCSRSTFTASMRWVEVEMSFSV